MYYQEENLVIEIEGKYYCGCGCELKEEQELEMGFCFNCFEGNELKVDLRRKE